MSTASHRKGAQWERDIVAYLRGRGIDAERTYGAGRPQDIGDVRGLHGFVIEAKNHARHELATWMDECEVECENARETFGVVIVKRRLRPVSQAYAVMPLHQLVALHEMTGL